MSVKVFLGVLLCSVALPFSVAEAHTRITTELTWGEHIRPIFAQKCMPCHRPGGSAPEYVDLTVYGTVTEPGARAWAVAIEEEILSQHMPPWQADDRFAPLDDHARLTTQELDYIISWIEGGAPQGEPRNLPAPAAFSQTQWRFGEPDVVLGEESPFVLKADVDSDTATYTFSVSLEADTFITGYEFLIDQPRYVRAITAWVTPPKGDTPPLEMEVKLVYDPMLDSDELTQRTYREHPVGMQRLGQWGKGDATILFPQGAGRYLPKESTITIRVEYVRPDYSDEEGAVPVQMHLGLFEAGENEDIDLLVESLELAYDSNEDDGYLVKESIDLFSVTPQIATTRRDIEVSVTYPDGRTRPVVFIPNSNPQWNMSYRLAAPVSAPAGSIIHARTQRGESVMVGFDYVLHDHIYIEPFVIPTVAGVRAAGGGMQLGSFLDGGGVTEQEDAPGVAEEAGIYWCPMRGNPCGLDDYVEGGTCKDCAMDVRLRASFFEGESLALDHYDWDLSKRGQGEVYWCPNRGSEGHTLREYPRPGTCEVCTSPLAHRGQFEDTHTYVCMVPTCDRYQDRYYGPGLCEGCGQPVAGMGHMDHTPLHGGWQFFMANNLFHHLEGTMPEEGVFKLYLYDDWKVPLDARNVKGKLFVEYDDPVTGEFGETEYDLAPTQEGDTWLLAEIPKGFPVDFYIMIWLAGEEKRYDFTFDALTVAPAPSEVQESEFRLHAHNCPPLELPTTPEAIVREVLNRDRSIAAHLEAQDWLRLHCPAQETKILIEALIARSLDSPSSDRIRLKKVQGMVNRSALALDYAGDIADAPRAHRAYEEYREMIALLRSVYPKVNP